MIHVRSAFVKDYSVDGFALDVLETLQEYNVPFKLHAGSFLDAAKIPERIKPFLDLRGIPSPSEFQLVINPACFVDQYCIDRQTIMYTVWDSTLMNRKFAFEINKGRLVMVPSEACKKCLVDSGVKIPIEVIPHGFHAIFHPLNNRPTHFPCVFGSGGQITTPKNDKKNLSKLLEAWRKAFPGQEDVFLHLKTSPESFFPTSFPDKRIKVLNSTVSKENMASWYRNLTCFVNVSKFEAFGQMMAESMACGIPNITTNASGMGTYFKDNMGYRVGYEITPTGNDTYPEGEWYDPKMDELIAMMRYVYENRQEVAARGMLAHIEIQSVSYLEFQRKFVDVVRRFAY